jgi:hypothetical protein
VSYDGVHVALAAEEAETLRRLSADADDPAFRARVRELVTTAPARFATDWYWEAIKRCLGDGEPGDEPERRGLDDAVLGGASLFDRPGHVVRIATLLAAGDVRETAAALTGVSRESFRARFDALDRLTYPSPLRPGGAEWFPVLWERFTGLTAFFGEAAQNERAVLFVVAHLRWRPPREETGPDGPYLVRRPYRPEDYAVVPSQTRTLPMRGGDMPVEWELTERDGSMYAAWKEVRRFIRNGRTWVRVMHASGDEYCLDVETGDGRILRIEPVDPLLAYWEARQSDQHPVVLEDW